MNFSSNDPPILDNLNNPRMSVGEVRYHVDRLIDLIVVPADKGDVISPIRIIYEFLLDFATRMIAPENNLKMTKQNVISLYNACHLNIIDRITSVSKQTKLEDYGIFLEDLSIPR